MRKLSIFLLAVLFTVCSVAVAGTGDRVRVECVDDPSNPLYTSELACNSLGQIMMAGFSQIADALRSTETNPLDMRYVGETLADVTNGADTTFDYYVDMSGYRKSGFQLDLDCAAGTVTAKIYCSLQDDGDAPADCAYQDVTNDTFGVASLVASAGAAADIWIDDTGALGVCHYVKVEIVAATGATTGDWTIFHKRLW